MQDHGHCERPLDNSVCSKGHTHIVEPQESALQATSSSPTLYLITACGDPYKPGCPIQISNHKPGTAEFDSLNRLLGMTAHSFGMYTTLRPQCSYSYEYDESLMHLKAIGESVFSVRTATPRLTTFAPSPPRPRSDEFACSRLCHEDPNLGPELRGFPLLSKTR